MKRLVLLALMLALVMASFSGCIMIPMFKTYDIDAASVSSVEIYDLCNYTGSGSNFLDTVAPACQLTQEDTADFLYDLSQIRFSDYVLIILAPMDPSMYYGTWTVRVNYTDGTYELISCDGYGQTFDENGEETDSHHYSCDEDEWAWLIESYVPQNVFLHAHKEM